VNLAETTRIRIEGQCTTLARRMEPEVAVAVGVRHVAEGLFRHDPPTALEIEQAIDRVEDALTASDLTPMADVLVFFQWGRTDLQWPVFDRTRIGLAQGQRVSVIESTPRMRWLQPDCAGAPPAC
jgi:hypothetical protein